MQKPNSYLSSPGFTVLELLLLISMIGIITIIGTPFLFGSLEKKRLLTERDRLVSELKTAQQQSKVAQDGRRYGLRFSPYQVVTIPDNEIIRLEHGVKLAQFTSPTILFDKLSGSTRVENTDTSLELVLSSQSFFTEILVNSYGVIDVTSPAKR